MLSSMAFLLSHLKQLLHRMKNMIWCGIQWYYVTGLVCTSQFKHTDTDVHYSVDGPQRNLASHAFSKLGIAPTPSPFTTCASSFTF